MKGLIYVNPFLNYKEYLYQPRRMSEEFAALGVQTDIVSNVGMDLRILNAKPDLTFSDHDFCSFWDKDKYALAIFEKLGVPTVNSKKAILDCDDKMSTIIELSGRGVPVPDTLPGLLCFNADSTVPESTLSAAERILGYPMIVKESFGSQGKGVYLAENRAELSDIWQKINTRPHLFQRFISDSVGKDLRVIVIGGKAIGGMIRTSNTDFRSNVGAGGKGEKAILSPTEIALSEKVASLLGLDYCGVDLLLTKDGPVVCEVNSNAFFREFERVTGINVARRLAEHVISKVSK